MLGKDPPHMARGGETRAMRQAFHVEPRLLEKLLGKRHPHEVDVIDDRLTDMFAKET